MGFVCLHGKELLLYVLLCWLVSLASFFGIGYLIIKLVERKKYKLRSFRFASPVRLRTQMS